MHLRGFRQAKYLAILGNDVTVHYNRTTMGVEETHNYGSLAFEKVNGRTGLRRLRSLDYALSCVVDSSGGGRPDAVVISNDPSQISSAFILLNQTARRMPSFVDMTEHVTESRRFVHDISYEWGSNVFWEGVLLKLSRKNFVQSQERIAMLPPGNKAKSILIPNAADLELYAPTRGLEAQAKETRDNIGSDFVAIYLGRLDHSYGGTHGLILDTVATLAERFSPKEFKLLLVGDDSFELRSAIREKGLQDHIMTIAEVPNDRIPPLVLSSDIGLAPYPENSLTDLALGNKLFEYWSASKPVLVTRVRAMARLVISGGAGFVASGSASFAQVLTQCMADPEGTRNAGLRGRELVEKQYNWLENAKLMEAEFEKAQ